MYFYMIIHTNISNKNYTWVPIQKILTSELINNKVVDPIIKNILNNLQLNFNTLEYYPEFNLCEKIDHINSLPNLTNLEFYILKSILLFL